MFISFFQFLNHKMSQYKGSEMSTILIIDDNEDFRETLGELLELEGYQILEAADGEKGVEVYRENSVDLVITDLIMPNQDGIKTIVELRAICSDVKIITISGGGRTCPDPELFLEAAQGLGSLRSFRKPLDRAEFLAATCEILLLEKD